MTEAAKQARIDELCQYVVNQYDYYKDINGVVIIDAIVADTEELIIPSQLNGLDVIGLASESFNGYNSNNHNITKKIV